MNSYRAPSKRKKRCDVQLPAASRPAWAPFIPRDKGNEVGTEVISGQPGSLTFAVSVEVQHAAGPHHGLQRDDLVQRHPEQLVVVEAAGGGVVGLVGPEVVVAEGEPLLPREERGSGSNDGETLVSIQLFAGRRERGPQHLLFIFPQLLDAEDVKFVSVNV